MFVNKTLNQKVCEGIFDLHMCDSYKQHCHNFVNLSLEQAYYSYITSSGMHQIM